MRHCAPRALPTGRRAALAALLGMPSLARARLQPTLAEQLSRTLAQCGLPAAHLGLCAGPVDDLRELAAVNADQPIVMASTAKLVTSLAALDLLGARWRWRTHAFATGRIDGGRLRGDLMIVGGGDPRLSPAELRQWLQRLRAGGLAEIDGDLVVDRSAFLLSEQDHAGTPVPAPERPHHARPDALLGLPADTLATLWREAGGRLGGRVREGDLAAGRADASRLPLLDRDGEPLLPLATLLSPPLPEVVHEVNKNSHNLAARHLLLSLSPGFPIQPATLQRARLRLQQWLQRQGLVAGDIELDNGSGLSRAERCRPRAMVQLLRRAWIARESRAFVESLPVAGVDGTLAHRLQHGAATGQAFLKTGTLLDTRALAGYVRARSGRVHAVAVFAHHPDAARATPAIDAVIEQIARAA
ncbi:MAG: D-alanyl-D-alanine carboxypeptidase [Rubrivivax sp.]